MKISRPTLTVSLVLNLILLATAGFLFRRPAPTPVARVVTHTVVRNEPGTALTNLPVPIPEAKTNAPFDWSMVASVDLAIYVANLRAIGCPKPTIRDIITAEVDEIYLKKLAGLLDPVRRAFWVILANWRTQKEDLDGIEKDLDKLSDERKEMLKKLLGAEKDSTADTHPANPGREALLNFLPPEKQEQIAALEKRNQEEKQKMIEEAQKEDRTIDTKTWRALSKKWDEERKALMTSEEFEEYQMRSRYSYFLHNTAMPDFSAEELRALAKAKLDFFQSQPPLPEQSDSSYKTKLAERQKAQRQQEKSFLGEDRYAEFTRSEDGNFQQVYRVTERYNLPRDTAVKVYELQKSTTAQADQLRKATNLSDDERAELLSALQQETQRNVNATLGGNAAQTYQEHGGQWLRVIAPDE
jgi:hypothetical protein